MREGRDRDRASVGRGQKKIRLGLGKRWGDSVNVKWVAHSIADIVGQTFLARNGYIVG